MDVDIKHVLEVRVAMHNVLSELQDLGGDELSAQGTEDDTTHQRESSICKAIYKLGNVASPETRTTMSRFFPSTEQFVEVRELGVGRHGVVIQARDISETGGEIVALKTLHPKELYYANVHEKEGTTNLSYHLLREACFMAACRGHPSLVSLSAVARHPRTGQYCLVMEHVGPSLYDVLVDQRGGKPFPEHDVRRMMRQILSGATAMHDRGVVHRAINPTNILVGDGGNVVKIGDYGEASSVFEYRVPCCTKISYVAPECLPRTPSGFGEDDVVIDSWSMGCLMLELLTGEDHFLGVEEVDSNDVEGQVQRIHHVLGLSDEKSMEEEAMKPAAVDVELAPEVQRYRAQWPGRMQQRSRLRELVPREVLSDDGFEVLLGLLACSPRARLTANQALQLPWFADTFDETPVSRRAAGLVMRPWTFFWVLLGAVALILFLMVFACLRGLY